MKVAILVDANIYLEFYRADLSELAEALPQFSGLLVTRQIAQEVERNRVGVVVTLLKGLAIRGIKAIGGAIPTQFASEFDASEMITDFNRAVSGLTENLPVQMSGLLRKVADGIDPVTLTLRPILERAVGETPEELARARARKERGTPPGKRGDPLGDQITWEQFLTHVEREKPARVVIVTRDRDYGDTWEKTTFLNPVLAGELQTAARGCKIEAYGRLADALGALRNVAGAKVPSAKELRKAGNAEEAAAAAEGVTLLESLGVRTVLPTMFLGGSFGGPSLEEFERAWRRQMMRSEMISPVLPPQEVSGAKGPGMEQVPEKSGKPADKNTKDEK